jgi:phosphoribosyl-ATP pyrophosphohydrolase/phosphoribosyl-AMP cyclohydrolase
MNIDNVKFDEKGLVPVVVQDIKTNSVLMLAYMNRESLQITLETGNMTYFSRSRQKLWRKGETSGHYQTLKEMKLDCDGDTLLALVSQKGPACHTGNYSCFFESLYGKGEYSGGYGVIDELFAVIEDRRDNPKEGSYTNYLFDKGIDKICKKVGEEAAEIIIAAKNAAPDEIRYESADFLYHLLVLLCERGLTPGEVFAELEKRR